MYRLLFILSTYFLFLPPVAAQEADATSVERRLQSSIAHSERFVRKVARRTAKAEKRMVKYEQQLVQMGERVDKGTGKREDRKRNKVPGSKFRVQGSKTLPATDSVTGYSSSVTNHVAKPAQSKNDNLAQRNNQKSKMAHEPMLDSLNLYYGFAEKSGVGGALPGEALESLGQAQQQLDVTAETKKQMRQQRDYWKAQAKEHPEYQKIAGRMDKETYYYSAQVDEYRKKLRDPALLEEQVVQALRKDPRWNEYLSSLPQPQQDPAKMQPKELVQQMMKSQAAAIDPNAMKLISDARKKGSELLGELSKATGSVGNLDNAAQMPDFKPNPYKTKSLWERMDFGFGLQFDNRTYFLPSSGTAGAQLTFHFTEIISAGALANYRFGLGEDIKHIRLTHIGWGYGVFVNGTFWKGFGVQGGFERNYRTAFDAREDLSFEAGWTSSALLGVTKEYNIGKKMKGSAAVFYDFLHKSHTPQTNAVVWRMGWKF